MLKGQFHFTYNYIDYYIFYYSDVLAQQAKDYVIGLQWILYYYYTGVPSWGWFFPHHYAPYMSDLHSFCDIEVELDPGVPFMPFQQLMAVLPSGSKDLLPVAYQVYIIHVHVQYAIIHNPLLGLYIALIQQSAT